MVRSLSAGRSPDGGRPLPFPVRPGLFTRVAHSGSDATRTRPAPGYAVGGPLQPSGHHPSKQVTCKNTLGLVPGQVRQQMRPPRASRSGTLPTRSGATLKDTMVRADQSSEKAALIYQHSDDDRQQEVAACLDATVRKAHQEAAAVPEQETSNPDDQPSGTDLTRDD